MLMIQKNIYFIEAPKKGRYPYCHCIYIDDRIRAIFDTACGKEQARALNAQGVEVIVNTHYHYDHSRYNYLFPQAQIWIHTLDAPPLSSREAYVEAYGFESEEEERRSQNFIPLVTYRPYKVDREFRDKEILDFGQVKLQVIHTPGHSPGHCCFYLEKTGLLIAGDIDLSLFGPWYAHGNCNLEELISSIKICMEIDPKLMLTSHTGIVREQLQKRLQDFLQVLYIKEDMLLEALRIPQTMEELVNKRIYSLKSHGLSEDIDDFHEKVGIKKHLEKLLREKRICYDEGSYFLC